MKGKISGREIVDTDKVRHTVPYRRRAETETKQKKKGGGRGGGPSGLPAKVDAVPK